MRYTFNRLFYKLDVFIFLIMNELYTPLVYQECKHYYPYKFMVLFIFVEFFDKIFFITIHSQLIFFSGNDKISGKIRK